MRLTVEPAEVMPSRTKRPGDPVPSGILVVVGVGRGDEGETELAGSLDSGDAERNSVATWTTSGRNWARSSTTSRMRGKAHCTSG